MSLYIKISDAAACEKYRFIVFGMHILSRIVNASNGQDNK
jgi:hypothetical protein